MEMWELEAHEQIRDTIARYAHCVDGGRFDDLVALFTPDGVLEVEGEPAHRGRDAIRAFVAGTGRDLAAGTGARPDPAPREQRADRARGARSIPGPLLLPRRDRSRR